MIDDLVQRMYTDDGKGGGRYPFSIIRERIAARERTGRVLDFAIGRHQPAPPAALLELIRREPEMALRRRRRTELDDLRDRAATMLAREYRVRVAPECILPAPGGRAAFACAGPDGVLIPL